MGKGEAYHKGVPCPWESRVNRPLSQGWLFHIVELYSIVSIDLYRFVVVEYGWIGVSCKSTSLKVPGKSSPLIVYFLSLFQCSVFFPLLFVHPNNSLDFVSRISRKHDRFDTETMSTKSQACAPECIHEVCEQATWEFTGSIRQAIATDLFPPYRENPERYSE